MSNDLIPRRQRRSANQIAPDLWRIPLARGTVNSYLLKSSDGLILVDCGYPGGGHRLAAVIDALGFSLDQLHRIVLTHSDLDHAGALPELLGLTEAEVLAHSLEVDLINGRAKRSWPGSLGGRLLAASYPLMAYRNSHRNGHDLVDRELEDGQSIDKWAVIHCPGHTPGHIALYDADSHTLIAGDALGWRGGRLSGPMPLYATDLDQAVRSVRRLADLHPQTLLFGHRSPAIDPSGEALNQLHTRLEKTVARSWQMPNAPVQRFDPGKISTKSNIRR